jgi:hypothetical protein
MKKTMFLILMLFVLAAVALADTTATATSTPTQTPIYTSGANSMVSALGTATVGPVLLYRGTFTVTSIQSLWSKATPSANTALYLYDAPDNVSTPIPGHGVTFTAGANGLYKTGEVSVQTNGAGGALYSGQKFVKGVCIYSPGVDQVTSINGHN